MRIWGNVVLIIAILFLLLFGLAEMGGGHLGLAPFIVMVFLILIGARLRSSGRGLVQTQPAVGTETSSAPSIAGHAAAPAPQFSTVEMPLTPDVAALIVGQSARTKRILLYVAGGFFVLFAGMGVVVDAADKTPGEGQTFLLVFGGVGVASAILIYAISWLTALRPVRRDLRGTTYLRTTGPVKVVRISTGAMLRLADRAFLIDRRYGITQLSALGWGTVDYSPHGHVILGAWDNQGQSVYCIPGYSVGSGGFRG